MWHRSSRLPGTLVAFTRDCRLSTLRTERLSHFLVGAHVKEPVPGTEPTLLEEVCKIYRGGHTRQCSKPCAQGLTLKALDGLITMAARLSLGFTTSAAFRFQAGDLQLPQRFCSRGFNRAGFGFPFGSFSFGNVRAPQMSHSGRTMVLSAIDASLTPIVRKVYKETGRA